MLVEMGPRAESVLSGRYAAVSLAVVRKAVMLLRAVAGEIGVRVCRTNGGSAVVMVGDGVLFERGCW